MKENYEKFQNSDEKITNYKKILKLTCNNYRSIKECTPQFINLFSKYKNRNLPKLKRSTIDSYIKTFRCYGTDEREEEIFINKELKEEKEKYKKLNELIISKKSFNLKEYNEKINKNNPKKEYKLKVNKEIFIKTLNNFSLKKRKKNNINSLVDSSKMFTSAKPLTRICNKRNLDKPIDLKTFYTNITYTESKHSLLSTRQKIDLDNYCDKLSNDAEFILNNTRTKFITKSRDYKNYFQSLKLNRNIVFKSPKIINKIF